ncbi:hypothetical protein PDL05_11785 [Bacillus cereus group sp. BY112LC]|uniref:hypothetical protein n=1 Tax=Bacillus cereus group sp. BY112LC TaxID=3018086 RepID=UPI0022E3F664|nr:hypothetical protein [Bacillus cereus group sp. BY112LC]MDA1874419.1 hypothetical protein [Bacillus cereus group sp. BY112LC]
MSKENSKQGTIQKQINDKLNNLSQGQSKSTKPKSVIKAKNSSIFSKSVKPFEIK